MSARQRESDGQPRAAGSTRDVARDPSDPEPQGDEGALFQAFNDDLTRSVSHAVFTTTETIDDACAFAWTQFLRYQPDRDRNWQGWLFRVAQREAWRLDEVAKRTIPYDPQEQPEQGVLSVHQVASPGDSQWQRVELNAVTDILASLPPRVRQVALLRATGTGYKEISELTGNSLTTVHKLVRRANESVGEAVRDATRDDRSKSPRVQRLESLERKPPRGWWPRSDGPRGGRRPRAVGLPGVERPWRSTTTGASPASVMSVRRSASGRATRRPHAPTRQPPER